jgi:predicted RecA/RadA family phage recombinase
MATQILSPDYHTVNFAHTAIVAAKAFFISNGRVFMGLNATGANEAGAHVYKAERIQVPKATGAAWAVGDKLYWDPVASKFTKTSTDNTYAGMAVAVAASDDTEGEMELNPFSLA